MAFIPTATLGSTSANLGEFILGVLEPPPVNSFTCSGASSGSFTGKLYLGGKFTASGAASFKSSEGYLVFRRHLRIPSRSIAPPLGSLASNQGLMLAAYVNEGCGTSLFEAVTGQLVPWTTSGGAAPTRGAGSAGEFLQMQDNTVANYWSFGSDNRVSCPNAVTAVFFSEGRVGNIDSGQPFGRYTSSTQADWGFQVTQDFFHNTGINAVVNTAGGQVTASFSTGTDSVQTSPTTGLIMLALTYDGAKLTLYFNGQAVATATGNALSETAGKPVTMGGNLNSGNTHWVNGMYAGYLWSRTLGAAEIAKLWERAYDFVPPIQRWIVINPATTYFEGVFKVSGVGKLSSTGLRTALGTFTAAGKGTAAWTGAARLAGTFTASGKATASWTGAARLAGTFSANGVGTANWRGTASTDSVFACHGVGKASWTAATGSGSTTFRCDGSSTAAWLGTALRSGAFQSDGKAAARWDGVVNSGPLLGVFVCHGIGTAYFLVGLDGVVFTCLTEGDKPPVNVTLPNFVF